MPITPGGRFSPGDSDEWDLTTDLAAMQVSNETATANEIATAVAAIPTPIPVYRTGTDAQRLALSGTSLVPGMRFQTTTNGSFEWINTNGTAGGWRISPGQTLASGEFAASTTAGNTVIGAVVSTIPLPIGQKVRIHTRPVGLALPTASTGPVVYSLRARNNASDVSFGTYDKMTTMRGNVSMTGGNVHTVPGNSFEFTTTVAAKVSAAIFTQNGIVYNVDGQGVWIESI